MNININIFIILIQNYQEMIKEDYHQMINIFIIKLLGCYFIKDLNIIKVNYINWIYKMDNKI